MLDLFATPGDGKGNDIAFKWIEVLFNTGPESGFGQAFSVFTSMLGLLGGLFLGWHIVIGIVSSAYSGKVLGERYHQIWAPLRVVLGFGLLIPIAGGFSSVHYVLKEVIGRAAVNMGNAPIIAYIDHLAANGGEISLTSMSGRQLVIDVIEREVCTTVRNAIYNNSYFGVSGEIALPEKPTTRIQSGSITTTWSYGWCGSIGFTTTIADDGLAGSEEDKTRRFSDFHKKRDDATQAVINTVRSKIDVRKSAEDKMSVLGEYFATKSYSDRPAGEVAAELEKAGIISKHIATTIEDEARKWNKAVGAAASEVYKGASSENKENLAKRIKEYGFMMAGSYERDISKISGTTSSLANATPVKTTPNPGRSYYEAYAAAFNAVLAARALDNMTLSEDGSMIASDGGDTVTTLLSSILPSADDMQIKNMSGDPIGSMITYGHYLLGAAASAIAAMLLLNGTANAAAEGTGFFKLLPGVGAASGFLSGVLSYFGQWVTYLILIFLVVGMLHAYVLPMIPMIMVFVMGVSWLIMFLEAAIAGVLWAFAFIRMDGNEFFDRNQAPGVTLIFNLFLRPAIGMLAFIGGLLLLPVLLLSLNIIWDEAFYAQTGSMGILFFIQYAVKLVMWAWMQWHLTLRLFGLIPTIADRVGHWMGFSGTHGYNDGQETHAAAGAMVAAGMATAKAPIAPQKLPVKQPQVKTPPPPQSGGGQGGGKEE